MARRVFFSFHYERDVWRVNIVRNSWVTKEREAAGYWDAGLWEEAKKKGSDALKKLINDGLANTTVTVVLIGAETASREWVKYEIAKSVERGNGLLGIYIHQIKDVDRNVDTKGTNPFYGMKVKGSDGKEVDLSSTPTYDWVDGKGYDNFGDWVEKAAKAAGK